MEDWMGVPVFGEVQLVGLGADMCNNPERASKPEQKLVIPMQMPVTSTYQHIIVDLELLEGVMYIV